MKICFFHLMPYRFLPDDFENRYRSVWVDVPHSLYDPEKTSRLYHEFLDELEFAEQAGFDGLCVNEHHNLVMQAWTRPEVFPFNGKYTQVRYVNIWPQPLQKPHPPVWIPGGGSVETWEWTAKLDYVYCNLSYYGYKRGKATMDGFWNAIATAGADDNPYRAGFLQLVCVADSDAEAERLYFPHVHYFYQ